jgi:putative endonuclease
MLSIEQDDLPPPPTTSERGATEESYAVDLLRAHGYRIVAQNVKLKAGELDIVARDGDVLVFVEVRSRNSAHGDVSEMFGPRKQRKVLRVAQLYLELVRPQYDEVRFDVVAISGAHAELIKDAFRASPYW